MNLQHRMKMVEVALGKKQADLVLKNGRIVNVFTESVDFGDVAIVEGKIVGIGEYEGLHEVDLKGAFVVPGLIDAHVHIESSMLTPGQYARAVVPKGTTTVIADPHEIANVVGKKGLNYLLTCKENLPLDIFLMLPSCVPATPFEHSGACLNAKDLSEYILNESVLGLGEVMNAPGIFQLDKDLFEKLQLGDQKVIDGHGPGLTGKELNAYIVSGVMTDHECTTVEEMKERLQKGIYIQIREGSAAKNLDVLIQGVTRQNKHRIMFCSDDRHPKDLLQEGHMDHCVRHAIKQGISPIEAIQMATIHAANCYELKNRGAIAPGYIADLIIVETLDQFKVKEVYKNGVLVAQNGVSKFDVTEIMDENVKHTVNVKQVENIDFNIPLTSDIVQVIQMMPSSIETKNVVRKVDMVNRLYFANPKLNILKIAVIERHHKTGAVGKALIEGYQLKEGAIGLTIAHDSHNMIVVGKDDEDMRCVVKRLIEIEGGIVIVNKGEVIGELALPIAGLMTDQPLEVVYDALEKLEKVARGLGVPKEYDPFMSLAFMALPVIPELKITDSGLFDVLKYKFVNLEDV